ncbi:hypothetical protein FACS18949_13680 [Clostridia bacterium]|nr:hypothetical protein FACS18949_13680 [Clostridia bacterium]
MLKVYDSRDPEYRSPYGAVPQGTVVSVSFRPFRNWGLTSVTIMLWDDERREMLKIPMRWAGTRGAQELYQADIETGNLLGPTWYHFRMERAGGGELFYGNNERCRGGVGRTYDGTPPGYQMTVYLPEYTVPDWYGRGVTYQIFPDRFRRLKKPDAKAVKQMVGGRVVHDDWYEAPVHRPDLNGEVKNNDFFGGSLAGVKEKLPYLYEMGVTTIYFNPLFEAASNHRYDTGDYMRIDPMLGTEKQFAELCKEAKEKYGIRVILDGVFNHTGFDSRYFNGRGTYAEPGAHQSRDSRYYSWYSFSDWPSNYESWWGIYTLPRVSASDYIDFIARDEDSVIRHWLKAGASGWRLDVADELTDEFIEEIRVALRKECPDGILIGEVWEDASSKVAYDKRRRYLLGRGLDSVMNYPFRTALIAFLRGGDAREFVEDMEALRENYPKAAFMSLMNLIGTHDSPRALTVLACDDADFQLSKDERAAKTLSPYQKALGLMRMKLAAAIQFSFPGSPLVYYGDEACMEGYEDPFNRRGYPWEREHQGLLSWYRRLGNARRNSEALRFGDIDYLYVKEGLLVYRRTSKNETVVVAVNRSMERMVCELPWRRRAASDLMSGANLRASGGTLTLELEPLTAMFLH